MKRRFCFTQRALIKIIKVLTLDSYVLQNFDLNHVIIYIEYTNERSMIYNKDLKLVLCGVGCYRIILEIFKNFIESFDSIKFTNIVNFSKLEVF